jgi:hypothetical protein
MVARRDFEPLDPDAAAALYELTDAMTSAAGRPTYEISNYARPEHESRHNLTTGVMAITRASAGAHGRRLGMRTVRHRKPENFLSALARNAHGIGEEAPLSAAQAADEALVMGLRLSEGIDAAAVANRFGLPAVVDWDRDGLPDLVFFPDDGDRATTRVGCCSTISWERLLRPKLGFWRLARRIGGGSRRSGRWRRGRCRFGCIHGGHELIIVGWRRDIIFDRHVSVRRGSFVRHSVFIRKAISAS